MWECPPLRDGNASTSLRAPSRLAYGQSKALHIGSTVDKGVKRAGAGLAQRAKGAGCAAPAPPLAMSRDPGPGALQGTWVRPATWLGWTRAGPYILKKLKKYYTI